MSAFDENPFAVSHNLIWYHINIDTLIFTRVLQNVTNYYYNNYNCTDDSCFHFKEYKEQISMFLTFSRILLYSKLSQVPVPNRLTLKTISHSMPRKTLQLLETMQVYNFYLENSGAIVFKNLYFNQC